MLEKGKFHGGVNVLNGVCFMFSDPYEKNKEYTGKYVSGSYAINLPNMLLRTKEQNKTFIQKFTEGISHELLHKLIHRLTGSLDISKELDYIINSYPKFYEFMSGFETPNIITKKRVTA